MRKEISLNALQRIDCLLNGHKMDMLLNIDSTDMFIFINFYVL